MSRAADPAMDTTSLPPDDRPPVARPRRTNRGLLWASALAVVVLAIATAVAFTAGNGDDAQKLGGSENAPIEGFGDETDVSGQALPQLSYTTFDGGKVGLATDGRPMVVNFWAANCTPCRAEMPAFEQVFTGNQDRIDFLGIQVAEAPDRGKAFIQATGATYPMGRDVSGAIFEAFGGKNLPRTALIAGDGTIVATHRGELSQSELQALIDEHFGS